MVPRPTFNGFIDKFTGFDKFTAWVVRNRWGNGNRTFMCSFPVLLSIKARRMPMLLRGARGAAAAVGRFHLSIKAWGRFPVLLRGWPMFDRQTLGARLLSELDFEAR